MSSLRLHATSLLAALLLMAFAVFNGYATFFNDSRSYIRGGMTVVDTILHTKSAPEWKSRVEMAADPERSARARRIAPGTAATVAPEAEPPTANRSVYYGLLAFLGYATSNFWLTIFVQAYAVGFVMAIVARRLYAVPGWAAIAVVIAPVAVLTTVGPFIANIMPDIFTGIGVLAAALVLCAWRRLSRADRVGLFVLISFGLLAHTSHVAILAVLLTLALPLLWWRRRDAPLLANAPLLAPAGFLVAAMVVAIAGVTAYNVAATRVSGQKPLLMPHVTAHLVEMGPGMKLIHDRCPEAGFAVCKFESRLPVPWIDFISSRNRDTGVFEITDLATKRRLSDEQIPFALAVAAHDPVGLAIGLARDVVIQLGWFNLRTMKHNDKVAENFDLNFPAAVAAAITASRIGVSDQPLAVIETTNLVATILGVGVVGVAIAQGFAAGGARRELAIFFLVIAIGLFANAIVCGGLASPNPRFQARVVWLLPFLALAHLVWGRYPARPLPPPATS